MKPFFYQLFFTLSTFFLKPISACPQALTELQVDSLAKKDMGLFQVPGLAIGIIKDGKLVYGKGFGVSSLSTKKPVDPHTLFGIASNSKAFTAAALGILVDEGKINWDDKVTRYIPEFRLYDELAAKEITIRDLLCHRSGLATGAGDLMHDPDSTDFTVKEIIYNLRFIKPAYSFRSKFAYDNNLYLVAGEVIARVSKMRWEDFVETRILKPLGMANSSASYNGIRQNGNTIDPHRKMNDTVKVITRYTSEKDDAAGGIYSDVEDMSKWLLLFLNNGRSGSGTGKQLLSGQTVKELLSPQTIIPVTEPGIYNTHFGAYGLGWFLTDVKGVKLASHTGEDVGMVSEVSLIPEIGLGIIVLTNNESNIADAITYQIIDSYLGINGIDESALSLKHLKKNEEFARNAKAKIWEDVISGKPAYHQEEYPGTYRDNYFGDVKIIFDKNKLWFASRRSQQLKGYLLPYREGVYFLRWQNPEIDADCFVTFKSGAGGKVQQFTIKPAVPGMGYNFDGLCFHKIN